MSGNLIDYGRSTFPHSCNGTDDVVLFVEQMSEVVGFELKPTHETNLTQMIEYGLSKHLDRYDPPS